MIQLSIVIPIYNVENYLDTCLSSVMTQDIPLTDYEVILINDGSSDGSLVIAERFAAQYSNVRLISQENRGLSGARNRGIEEAQGEYIWFIDSDDYIEIDCISVLLEYMISGGLDAMRFNYLNVNEKHEIVALNKNPKRHVHYDPMVKSGANFLEQDRKSDV